MLFMNIVFFRSSLIQWNISSKCFHFILGVCSNCLIITYIKIKMQQGPHEIACILLNIMDHCYHKLGFRLPKKIFILTNPF